MKSSTDSQPGSALTTHAREAILNSIAIRGDVSRLTETQIACYLRELADAVGVDLTSKPFDVMELGREKIVYANKSCTDQLRRLNNISIVVVSRGLSQAGDVYEVVARATTPGGVTDESIGAVGVKGLTGEALANARMKAETKAKRRVTLSICGLGLLDESEIRGAQRASTGHPDDVTARINAKIKQTDAAPVAEQDAVGVEVLPPKVELEPAPGTEPKDQPPTAAFADLGAWKDACGEVADRLGMSVQDRKDWVRGQLPDGVRLEDTDVEWRTRTYRDLAGRESGHDHTHGDDT